MSKIIDFKGNDRFYSREPSFGDCKESDNFSFFVGQEDMHFGPCKRSRIERAYSGYESEENERASIEILPDECLFEILRRLSRGQEKSACAAVSRRWLMLLSSMRRDEFCSMRYENQDGENDCFLTRCIDGDKATDTRLASIAVATSCRGGLGKLSIRSSVHSRKVTDVGLKAIARSCPSLKVLCLWEVPSVGDCGLAEIAKGCALLEKLDLCQCSGISDKGLIAIAEQCPNLASLCIESCMNIGNESLKALGRRCSNLKTISIKNCPLVTDGGVVSLFSSESQALAKVKLQSSNVKDLSLAVIGQYGKMVTDLHFSGLRFVKEKGFCVMGNSQGLQMLKSLSIVSCRGVTDLGLSAIGRGCPNLRQLCLRKCALLLDKGLFSLADSAGNLESLQLEECHGITERGLFGYIEKSCGSLKALSLVKCFGIKDWSLELDVNVSLRSLSIQNCPGFGDACLNGLRTVFPQLQLLSLVGLDRVTDAGFRGFLQHCKTGLVKVSLSGCLYLTDESFSLMIKFCGSTLKVLNLNGCTRITDASLVAIANNCLFLNDLDVSSTAISDYGLAILAGAKHISLKILSISRCASISNKSIPYLMKMGCTLVALNIQQCDAISRSSVRKLITQLWRCNILH